MKKRLFAALLLSAMLLALCACGAPAAQEAPLLPQAAASGPDDLPDIDITSWEYRLCNAYNSVAYYFGEYGPIEGQGLDPRVVDSAAALMRDARDQGYTIFMAQAFRNLEWIDTYYKLAFKACNRDPVLAAQTFQGIGVNEHQTGLAIDFTDDRANSANYSMFEDPEIFDIELYAWLLEHCADYGFVPRYPAGKEYWYGVACPHAHFRYVGVEAARYMMDHDLCLEEFISLYDPDRVFVPEHGRFA